MNFRKRPRNSHGSLVQRIIVCKKLCKITPIFLNGYTMEKKKKRLSSFALFHYFCIIKRKNACIFATS